MGTLVSTSKPDKKPDNTKESDNRLMELSGMAAINILTDKAIRAAIKAAREAGAKKTLNDGGGLRLAVQANDTGRWRFRYWLNSRENLLSMGVYPAVTLAAARDRRDDANRLIAAGIDPSEARKADKADKAETARRAEVEALVQAGEPLPGSFEAVAREWWTAIHTAKVSPGHAERTLIRLQNDVFPFIGRRPVAEIEPPELLAVLRKIEARGAIETAHRAKDACGQVFRFGIASGYCQRNPAADLKDALKPVRSRHHAAIVDPKGVAGLLRDMDAYQGHPYTRGALALSALLFMRPGEVRQLQWAWVDLEAAVLTVPAEAMKRRREGKANGVPHVVPLAWQAVEILRDDLQPLTGDGRYVFPSLLSGERPMSDGTVRTALRRMGYDKETMTAHGFRAMARTMIAERLSVDPHVIEAQLAHAVPDALGSAYNRAQFLDQRRIMMQAWADYLDRLRRGGEVIPLRSA
jgi:integrase